MAPVNFDRAAESAAIQKFLITWGTRFQLDLKQRKIDLTQCDFLAECVELVMQSIILRYPKMPRPDSHKRAAARSLVLYSFCRIYILSSSQSVLTLQNLVDVRAKIALDAFVTALPFLDASKMYGAGQTSSSKRRYRDLWVTFANQRPSIFALSMIGFYLEQEFRNTVSAQAPLSVAR